MAPTGDIWQAWSPPGVQRLRLNWGLYCGVGLVQAGTRAAHLLDRAFRNFASASSHRTAPRKDQARLLRRGTAAESGAHPCRKCGRLEAIRGLGGACPAPCVTGLGFLEGAGHPLPAEPMPGLAAPRGREDMAVAPSLLPSEFRGYRKGPADRAQALGPLHHPPFLAQPRLPGWHLDFLPPSPPPQALTLFFFSKSFSSGAWPGKWGEESPRRHLPPGGRESSG
ncbi:PREDICTED: uncharacterized protein LOC107532241 [Miniopterus natalensis]|uniref:uncharacterized protein LOC107532241 n=1 Tax=Miniopterus natalensis TaxID=291302 RepID=UPI0007A6E421|nr:PREDICTED: uncharacterized protein LOC107532241 [Miniopterus natalensis]